MGSYYDGMCKKDGDCDSNSTVLLKDFSSDTFWIKLAKGHSRLKVLWAITYTIAMQHYLFHFVLYKSIGTSSVTSWTLNLGYHPSIYSIPLFIKTI